jgi:glycine/D-amino acid oxidase-like deaminating enzyme
VLDANQPGWGASGRNGGVITAKFRLSFPAIAAAHGRGMAKRMYDIAHEATDIVAELVDAYGIDDANLTRSGQVKAAHNHETLAYAVKEAEWLRAELGDTTMSVLDADQVREETGSAGSMPARAGYTR